MVKWVYVFNKDKVDGNASMKNFLGGKGANLAEMCSIGVPVPPGFTITSEFCNKYYENKGKYPEDMVSQIEEALLLIEDSLGKKFGDSKNPLLFSVRSGGRVSMPGMMDTVLNLGLNDDTVEGLSAISNNPRFAYDSYRRFIQMYSDVVLGVKFIYFEEILDLKRKSKGVKYDSDLDADDLKDLITSYKSLIKDKLGRPFVQDVKEQLWGAIGAVFSSWQNKRAITYRRLHDIPDNWGTAVNVQSMVFGNMGTDSATGVAFTRDPSTGENSFFGEFLPNAQGEDVVAGIRTPHQITILGKEKNKVDYPSMEESMPKIYSDLEKIYKKLENHYKDMQDIEFTVQNNKLWILQTRNGKRSVSAAIKIAVDMVQEGLITKKEAVKRIDPDTLDQLLHSKLDSKAHKNIISKGLPASPGAASGEVVFFSEDAEKFKSLGRKVILVRTETSPEDINGMSVSEGILTSRGGMTSHAAVVARGMGKPCVSGAGGLQVDYNKKVCWAGVQSFKEGDIITIDGSSGDIILGEVASVKPQLSEDFLTLMDWADSFRKLKIYTNAETPLDAFNGREFGAEGVGLCRTEHMFFDSNRINAVRKMILSDDYDSRQEALDALLPMQRKDFEELFKIMDGLPFTVRLLDPPLHEFLPHSDKDTLEVSKSLNIDIDKLNLRISQLKEQNPMLGHRGCRLGITYPEIYEMQAYAIFEAAVSVKKEGIVIKPEIMIPLIFDKKEFDVLKELIDGVAKKVFEDRGVSLNYLVGTMIELPRAALKADEIAETAEFFSFGTNDLTQTTLGISRDDSASFISLYRDKNIIEKDPFEVIDKEGVGKLIKLAVDSARKVRPDIKLGICGEHGGNPASIDFFNKLGLDYISCSPYRIPVARLAASQAAIEDSES